MIRVIDVHNHIGVSKDGTVGRSDELLAIMDEYGIEMSVIFAINEKDVGDTYTHLNDRLMAIVKENPKRFIALCRVQPKSGKKAVEEMIRAKKAGFSGLKLHPRSEDFLPKHCKDVLQTAAKLEWPCMIHTDHNPFLGAEKWESTFREHKDVNFVLGHGGKDHWQNAANLALALPNVYVETSTLSYNRTRVLYELVGAKKVVFGSDYPYSHPCLERKKYELIVKDQKDFHQIMIENAKRLFKI